LSRRPAFYEAPAVFVEEIAMIFAVLTFSNPDLLDDEATLAKHINHLHGFRLAKWLIALLSAELRMDDEPIEEDWGYAVRVFENGDPPKDIFLLACSAEEEPEVRPRILISDNFVRGLLPSTRRRRTAALERLTKLVQERLAAQPQVRNLEIELEG
jgi:hypothetical protein